MAAVLNFDLDEGPTRTEADSAMATIISHLEHLPARIAVPLINRYRTQLDAAEYRSLATVIGDDGNTRAAESIAGKGGKTSKAARRQAAKRASAIKANSALADKMDAGDLSGEQVGLLADAADKTDGASLNDDDLIDEVAAVDPDKAKSVIDDHVAKNTNAGKQDTRHARQRRRRRVARFRTNDGCDAIMFAGDRETIDKIEAQVTRLANQFYRDAGGRDLPAGQHPRSHEQRQFDAAASFFNDRPAPAGTTPTPDCDPRIPAGDGPGSRSKRHTPKKTTERPTMVVTVTLDKAQGNDPNGVAFSVGHGPIADAVLAQYLDADPDFVGALFGHDGQLLWLGRSVRLATEGQILGLIIRDKGCVLCGAHHSRCRAHHLMPWTSAARGRTNIDELALVCEDCHTRLHANEQTLFKNRQTGTWTLRPALPHELPAPRPPQPNHGQGPMLT